jgi:hypothetical protein
MAILDFLPLFTRLAWTMHLVGPFLRRVFEEQGASVEPQLFVLACAVSASQPGIFDISEPGFLKMMLKAA